MEKNRDKPKNCNVLCCNVCGEVIAKQHGIFKKDVFEAAKEWGYFSKYDLEIHKFNICEDCYDAFVSTFKIPVYVEKKNEVL